MMLFLAAWALVTPAVWRVSGVKIVDSANEVVHIRGVNIPSLEWDDKGDHVHESIATAFDRWGVNFVRLPLCQDRWFGKTQTADGGQAYQTLVTQAVDEISRRGGHVLLDLHWSDGGAWGQNIGQHTLPDEHSREFWLSCAATFKNNPAVLFDLYNEPIEAPLKVWRDGGDVTEKFQGKDLSYRAVGLQQLLEAIRSTGAKNIVVAGGLGYSSRFDELPTYALTDANGNGVVYSDHFYPEWSRIEDWEPVLTNISKTYPVIVSEFGSDPGMQPMEDPKRRVAQVLDVLHRHDSNWVAWCLHPAAGPSLISDWNYTPTPYFGELVLEALKGGEPAIPPQREHAPDRTIYDGELKNNWQSWGVGDLNSTEVVHSGGKSIKADLSKGQLQLGGSPFNATPYRAISFWVNGGPEGGQLVTLTAQLGDAAQPAVPLPALAPNVWQKIEIPFDRLGIAGKPWVKSFAWHLAGGSHSSVFFMADVEVLGK